MVVSVGISETGRNGLGVTICVLCCLLTLSGISLIGLGLFIQVHLNNQLILLESYDDGLLPNFIVVVGGIMLVVNAACAKLAYDCGFASTSEKFYLTLIPLLVFLFLFLCVIATVGTFCLVRRSNIEEALHGGLRHAMDSYKTHLRLKIAMDKLQMKNRCCGSRAYTDWFNTGWINTEFIDTADPFVKAKIKDGNIFVDSVPFSCCDVKVARPCISHFVMNLTRHINYNAPTLYMVGCTDVLMNKLQKHILHPTGCFVFGLFGVQVLVFCLLRYLQTSLTSAYDEGDPEGEGMGYLFPYCCASCTTGDPNTHRDTRPYTRPDTRQYTHPYKHNDDDDDDDDDDEAMDPSKRAADNAYVDMGEPPDTDNTAGDTTLEDDEEEEESGGGEGEGKKSKWLPKKPNFMKKKPKKKKKPKRKKKAKEEEEVRREKRRREEKINDI